MRVMLDVTPLLGSPTGMYQLTRGLLEALVERSDVSVAGYAVSARAPDVELTAVASRFGLAVRRSRLPARLCHLGWSLSDRPALSRLVRGADIVHGTNYSAPPGPHRLITAPDLTPVTHAHWCSPAVRGTGDALRRAVQRGAHLHVTTHDEARRAAEVLDMPRERVHVVPVGIRIGPPGDRAAARRLVGSERFVLALGATEPRKGLTCLPPAVAQLPADVRLVVAGPRGRHEAALEAAVESSGISKRFLRLTEVDEARRADLLAGATVLAYPSLLEGFGMPPLEAAALGTPVVATAVGALTEILEPEVRLVPAGDAEAFAARLAQAVAEPFGTPSPVLARIAELTWASAAEQLLGVYRVIASS